MKKSVFEIATERIISLLENGVNPWRKTWSTSASIAPMNYASKRPYSGINFFLLSMRDNPYFMTFKQIKERGGTLRKGAKSEIVFFWLWTYFDANGNIIKDPELADKKIPKLRFYRVFNATDIEGIDFVYPEPPTLRPNEKIQNCEDLVKATNASIKTVNENQPYYRPSKDFINMPSIKRFDNSESYYATLFHELAHWTGAEKRLNRDSNGSFGDEKYSKEELVAELCSAYLCAQMGIDNDSMYHNSAAYLNGWIKVLKGDSKLIIQTASAAQKAFQFIMEFSTAETQKEHSIITI